MRSHTDSVETTYHEDGSWTTTSQVTNFPATKTEQAIAWTALVGTLVAPFALIGAAAWWENRYERREAKKAAKDKKPE